VDPRFKPFGINTMAVMALSGNDEGSMEG